jgi:hypothetical protein
MATWHIRSQNYQLRLPYIYFSLARNSIERKGESVHLATPEKKSQSCEKNRHFLTECAQGSRVYAGL